MRPTEAPFGAPTIGAIAHLPGRSGRTGRLIAAGVATAALHGAVALAILLAPPAEGPAPTRPRPSRPMRVVDLAEAPPPPPAPEPKTAPPPAAPVRQTRVARSAPAPGAARPAPPVPDPGPVAPAQAGQVVAVEAAAEPEILDFTGFDIATGSGERYVGGITSAAGTNTVAVHGGEVEHGGRNGPAGAAPSLARAVHLPARNWECPWPEEARSLRKETQEVVLRAEVDADGRARRVEILSDPGDGFGEAARRCALAVRFEPALDDAGRPVATRSPPIRVRFTR